MTTTETTNWHATVGDVYERPDCRYREDVYPRHIIDVLDDHPMSPEHCMTCNPQTPFDVSSPSWVVGEPVVRFSAHGLEVLDAPTIYECRECGVEIQKMRAVNYDSHVYWVNWRGHILDSEDGHFHTP